jgi:serine/threonine-protein kinase RsbW
LSKGYHVDVVAHRRAFPSDPAALIEARDLVRRFARDRGFSEAALSDIVAAVGEACANAVLYGARDKGFWVALDFEDGLLKVAVHDFGPGFSPTESEHGGAPDSSRVGGMGIYLMRTFVDEVTYQSGDDGTTVTLMKRLNQRSRPENT